MIWLIRGDCGDHYCGCGGGHLLAVAGSSDEADELALIARLRRNERWGYPNFSNVSIEGPHEAGKLIEEQFK